MAEIFNIDFRDGSLKEKYSGAIGVNVGNKLVQKEKGIVYEARQSNAGQITYNASDTTALNFGIKPFSMICAFRMGEFINIGSTYNLLFGKGTLASTEGVCIAITSDSYIQWLVGDGAGDFAGVLINDFGALRIGTWYFTCFTFDGTTYKAYLNTLEESSVSTTVKHITTTLDLYIGRDGITSRRCNSDILYIRAYDHCLTQLEMDKLYKEFQNSKPIQKSVNMQQKINHKVSNYDSGCILFHNYENGNSLDLSGNGNHGIDINPDYGIDGFNCTNANQYISLESKILNNDIVWSVSCLVDDVRCPNTHGFIFGGGATMNLLIKTSNFIAYRAEDLSYGNWNGTGATESAPSTLLRKKLNLIEWSSNGTDIYLFINGISYGYVTPTSTKMRLDSIIRGYNTSDWEVLGVYHYVKVHNYARTLNQHIENYNRIAKQVVFNEDMSNQRANQLTFPANTILENDWVINSGTHKISEDSDNGKSFECVSNGIIHHNSNVAYGTWEFNLSKELDASGVRIFFISDRIAGWRASEGYYFNINTNEGIYFVKNNVGSNNVLFNTAASYIAINTNYRIRIIRNVTGLFTIYIKGGSFGLYDWTVIDVTGGSGTNPVTDNTYETSKHMVIDLDSGDKIKNIKVQPGIIVE